MVHCSLRIRIKQMIIARAVRHLSPALGDGMPVHVLEQLLQRDSLSEQVLQGEQLFCTHLESHLVDRAKVGHFELVINIRHLKGVA